MTLNGVTALILRYFTEFDSFAGRYYVTALKMELIVCKISSHSYIWLKLIYAAVARSLCDS